MPISRSVFLSLAFFFVITGSFESKAQHAEQPNILWIVSEDNSPLIGAYGDTFATTPHLDELASEGVLYENAFATAPVCAPARSTLITGVYSTSMGTQHMRSQYHIPEMIKFFPLYLRKAGYYTSNNSKKDYNTVDQPEVWNESSRTATYKNRKPGQPFFAVFNLTVSHESSLHKPVSKLQHDPEKVPIPPYHPRTREMKHDWAQYYDKIQMMDVQVGQLLEDLKREGLAENTIVFYYSDHGGALGRSKRFMYESGLHVPLIIRFPEKYKHLAPGKPGSKTDRVVSFVDFAPTVLSLAGIPAPDFMQGRAFLGEQQKSPARYAFSFRGRMDERIDMVRSVRDKRYRYIKNYMPHKRYAQYIEYLWRAPSMQSWEKAFLAGELNRVQSKFWQSKPVEELYDVKADPHNIHNLAEDPEHQATLKRMREANHRWLLETRDAGFIPEAMMMDISGKSSLYEYVRSEAYPLSRIIDIAEKASSGDIKHLEEIVQNLQDEAPVVRYWAATGCTILGAKAAARAKDVLKQMIQDDDESVRIAAAEALFRIGEKDLAISTLTEALTSKNLMARVQVLNVLESMGQHAAPAYDAVRNLINNKPMKNSYDVRAAMHLLDY